MGPDTGEKIGLQLQANRQVIRVGLARPFLFRVDSITDAQQFLHMMAHLVGDDVGLGKVARCAQPAFHRFVKTQVDVDPLIRRTVEGADCGALYAARRLDPVAEQHQLGFTVGATLLAEEFRPHLLGVRQHDGHELAELVLWRLPGWRAPLRRRCWGTFCTTFSSSRGSAPKKTATNTTTSPISPPPMPIALGRMARRSSTLEL